MTVVSFDRIEKLFPDRTSDIGGSIAQGAISAGINRTSVYDPLWGYYTFGQGTTFSYNDADVYRDVTTYTIQGTFTVNASEVGTQDDETQFNTLLGKYTALETAMNNASMATAPTSLVNWGGASDPRAMVLPDPLRDKDDNVVYALPQSIVIQESRFAELVSYTAILFEARPPTAKLLINDQILDTGTIKISPPAPALATHTLVSASGQVLQVKHYTTTNAEISGVLRHDTVAQGVVPASVKTFVNGIELGQAKVSVVWVNNAGAIQTEVVWEAIDVDSGSIIIDPRSESTQVQFRVKA